MIKFRILISILVISLFLYHCSTQNGDSEPTSQLLILVVDFDQPVFEGGNISNLRQLPPPAPSKLPFELEEELPADGLDGGVSIFYSISEAKVLDALLPNDATASGNILIPVITDPGSFFVADSETPLPNPLMIEDIGGDYTGFDFSDIWPSINKLGVVRNTLEKDAMLGRYLYKPQPSNEDTWKWVIFFFEF